MLSRLFLISTLLLVEITTIAIGAPVAETIEVIKAVKIPQMGSGNLTLNRRFINGVPGLPQCTNDKYPGLLSSSCQDEKTIIANCQDPKYPQNPAVQSYSNCPERTSCMVFKTDSDPSLTPATENFAICIDDKFITRFDNGGKEGEYCKTYEIEGDPNGRATISIDIYDINQKPVAVQSITITTGTQFGSKQNTPTYSRIVDVSKTQQKIQACLRILAKSLWTYVLITFIKIVYYLTM